MEQVRSARAGDQRGAREGYEGSKSRTQAGSDGKEKERKLHFFSALPITPFAPFP